LHQSTQSAGRTSSFQGAECMRAMVTTLRRGSNIFATTHRANEMPKYPSRPQRRAESSVIAYFTHFRERPRVPVRPKSGSGIAVIGLPITIAVLTHCEQHKSTEWIALLLSGHERKPG